MRAKRRLILSPWDAILFEKAGFQEGRDFVVASNTDQEALLRAWRGMAIWLSDVLSSISVEPDEREKAAQVLRNFDVMLAADPEEEKRDDRV